MSWSSVATLCFALAYAVLPLHAQEYTWEVLTGTPRAWGSYDGSTGDARMYNPAGVAVEAQGTIYFADSGNHTIRVVAPSGHVATLAGVPERRGSSDGAGFMARFNRPSGLALDRFGNLYVADTDNHTIRRITPNGFVSTVAGKAQSPGKVDGVATQGRLNSPRALAFDADGNLFIADAMNGAIRKLSTDGTLSTFVTAYAFPTGVAYDQKTSRLYVATSQPPAISVVDAGGQITLLAGGTIPGHVDGTGAGASFSSPGQMTLDVNGDIYLLSGGHTLRKVTGGGVVTTLAGLGGKSGQADGTGVEARFYTPQGIAIAPDGDLVIADWGNHSIRIATPRGEVSTLIGGSERPQFEAIAFEVEAAGNLLISDGCAVVRVAADGSRTTVAGLRDSCSTLDGPAEQARFSEIRALAVDVNENIYVADTRAIRKISLAGDVSTFAKTSVVTGFAVDGNGTVYAATGEAQIILKITPAGTVSVLAGSPGNFGAVDGSGSEARFNYPADVATDDEGNIFVADEENGIIRKVTPDGVVTTYAGVVGRPRYYTTFNFPAYVATDHDGNVYFSEWVGVVNKVTPQGVVTRIGGDLVRVGDGGGTGTNSRLSMVFGLGVSRRGDVYVSDRTAIRIGRTTALRDSVVSVDGHAVAGEAIVLRSSPETADRWEWRIVQRPPGSIAELSSRVVRNPTFVPDAPGLFRFLLRAEGSLGVRYSIAPLRVSPGRNRPVRGGR